MSLIFPRLTETRAAESEVSPLAITFGPDQLQGETNIGQLAVTAGGQIIAGGDRVGFYENGRWEFLDQSRTVGIRALLVDGDILWVSSANEIGHLKLPLSKLSRYEKLALPELATAGEIWYLARRTNQLIATTKDSVWFIDLGRNELSIVSLPNSSRLTLHSLDGKLVVTSSGISPREIGDGALLPLKSPLSDPSDHQWFGMVPSHVVARSVYEKQGAHYVPVAKLETEGDKFLYTSVAKWGNLLAITSYNKGMMLFDPAKGSFRAVTHPTALASLGALDAVEDQLGRLWVGTTRGISLFEPFRFGQALPTKDHPLSAFKSEGLLINYDDRAEYRPPESPPELRRRTYVRILTSHGVATGYWGELTVGDEDFPLPGPVVQQIAELPDRTLLANCGERLYSVNYVTRETQLLTEPQSEVISLAVVGSSVWAATVSRELYRASATPPIAFTKFSALPKNSPSTVHPFGDTLIVANNERVSFGEELRAVEHTAGLKSPHLATTADGSVWLLGEQAGHWRLGRLRRQGPTVAWETVEAKGLAQLPGVQHLSASEGTLTICGGNMILELHIAELKPAYRVTPPNLQFTFREPQTGTVATRDTPPAELRADLNALAFRGTLPFDEFGERPRLERRLLPSETTWIATLAGENVAYPSLSPHDYTLEVRATHLGRTGPIQRHAFTVRQPWYFSRPAIGGYVAFGALLSFLTYRLRTHQMRQRNRELERIVAERTHELAEASAAKSEFVASMSHEIRNPMNGVIGLVNMLREQPGLPHQADHLRLLHRCAEQLRATVDDILDFSKIEARRVLIEASDFDLQETLEAATSSVDPSGGSIIFPDQPPAGIRLRGDAAKLRQILANYLNNALKYGVPPAARVDTILTPAGPDHVRLTLSVTSCGPTIEKDTLDKLFESFTRGDDAVQRNIRGTGLGLAICKRYAVAMGGEVGAVSTNGETTFYVHVPLEKIGERLPSSIDAAVADPHPTLPARALAIEDEDYNRIVLGDILAKMNYTVDWATTGAEALRLVQENGYDIILTDYRLPDTNGVELTKKILKICAVPKPAVFAVTAYSTRERREECLHAGMAGFISKPITLEKLRTTLFTWGDRQLTTISLEAAARNFQPPPAATEISALWLEVKLIATTDGKRAADQAHRLNNLCRVHHKTDIAEQLELLEGALERGEPTTQLVSAIERLLVA
jgi:signal transduction histidine kinase/CheY-like chemotaxis protein